MLRTCSEPDLLKLFRTNLVENPFFTDDEAAAVHVRADVTRYDAAAAVVDDDDGDADDADENDGATSSSSPVPRAPSRAVATSRGSWTSTPTCR